MLAVSGSPGSPSYSGRIYISRNGGTNWTPATSLRESWTTVCCSDEGTVFLTGAYGGGIYGSFDAGVHWTTTGAPFTNWLSLVCSSNSSTVLASSIETISGGAVWISTNSGASWSVGPTSQESRFSIACSPDGSMLVAGMRGGPILSSSDRGAAWSASNTPFGDWSAVTIFAAENRTIAARNFGTVYASPALPVLFIGFSDEIEVAWPASLSNFKLQRAAEINDNEWMDFTDESVTVGGLKELRSPLNRSRSYWRLKSR
jgi:hypothetical protein